jgi:hypothetical protein
VEWATLLLVTIQASVTLVLLVAGVVVRDLAAPPVCALSLAWLGVVLLLLRRDGIGRAIAAMRVLGGEARTYLRLLRWVPAAILAVASLLSLAWRATLALRWPVLDYDGVSYHLVTVAVWLQDGVIGRVPQRIWSDGYPANGELVSTWLALATGTSSLTTFTGMAGVPLGVIATIGLARIIGAGRRPAILAGLLFGAVPALVLLMSTTYVDTIAASTAVAAWYLGLSAMRAESGDRRTMLLIATGAAMGLACGTKGTNVLLMAAFGLVLLVAIGADARWRSRTTVAPGARAGVIEIARSVGPAAAALAIPTLLLGGYWYIKDLVVFGNPLWPFDLGPFAGLGRFSDLIVQVPDQLKPLGSLERIARSWTADPGLRSYPYDVRIGGFGVQWLPLLATAAVGLVVLLRRRRWLPLVGVVMPAAVTLLVMPMDWWPRLTLFVVPPAAALAAVTLTWLRPRPAWLVGIVLAVAATWSLSVATFGGHNFTLEPTGSSSFRGMARALVAPESERRQLGLWGTCAAFERLPVGATVATSGFNLLGLIAGQDFERRLAEPLRAADQAADVAAQMHERGATYLVALVGDPAARAAAGDPARFRALGPSCRGTTMFQLLGPGQP